jgi:hypothetical protein
MLVNCTHVHRALERQCMQGKKQKKGQSDLSVVQQRVITYYDAYLWGKFFWGKQRQWKPWMRKEWLWYHLLYNFLEFVYILRFLYENEIEIIELGIEDEEIRIR